VSPAHHQAANQGDNLDVAHPDRYCRANIVRRSAAAGSAAAGSAMGIVRPNPNAPFPSQGVCVISTTRPFRSVIVVFVSLS
jgi:hypothetical protein